MKTDNRLAFTFILGALALCMLLIGFSTAGTGSDFEARFAGAFVIAGLFGVLLVAHSLAVHAPQRVRREVVYVEAGEEYDEDDE